MNSTFETSREAYAQYSQSGAIGERQLEVLKALMEVGPMNQTGTYKAIVSMTGNKDMVERSVGPRFAELERMGLIRQLDKQKCRYTGRTTVFYEATRTRIVVPRSPTKKRETIATLKDRIAELEAKLAKFSRSVQTELFG